MPREKKKVNFKVEIKKEGQKRHVKSLSNYKLKLLKEEQKYGNCKKNQINKKEEEVQIQKKKIYQLPRINVLIYKIKLKNKNSKVNNKKIVMILMIRRSQKGSMEWAGIIIEMLSLFKT